MNFETATNQQLRTIIKYDKDCPKELMEQVVMEVLNRGQFKRLILKMIGGYKFNDMDQDDIEQIGNIAIWEALKVYEPGRAAFSSLACSLIKKYMYDITTRKKRMKRQATNYSLYLEDQKEDIHKVLPDETNVEKYVLHRIYFEQQISRLTKIQKAAVIGFMKGYRMKEIGQQLGCKRQSVERAFHTAVEKMGGEPISLKENCGVPMGGLGA